MATVQGKRAVLHRGRKGQELLAAQTAEMLDELDGGKLTPERRQHMIAESAYYRAEKRGFAPGNELQDWLDAEDELRRLFAWE